MSKEITENFKNRVIQYCLDCGVGIEYDETNDDGTKNLITEKELHHPMCKSVRYVHPDTVAWFLTDEILPKTQYVLKLEKEGTHIDMCDFDEWVAVCHIFNCPEMTYEDARSIIDALWNYEITPLDFDPRAKSLITRYMQAEDTVCSVCKEEQLNDCDNCPANKTYEKLIHALRKD